jgi:hypothetical protein
MRPRIELPPKCKLDLTGQAWAQRFLAKPVRQLGPSKNPPAAQPEAPPSRQRAAIQAQIEAELAVLGEKNRRAAKRLADDAPQQDAPPIVPGDS